MPDFATATVVLWDPDELEHEDDPPVLWEQSFTRTEGSLADWLERG